MARLVVILHTEIRAGRTRDTNELKKIRAIPTAPKSMLHLFGTTLDGRLRDRLIDQLRRVAQKDPSHMESLNPTDDEFALLVHERNRRKTDADVVLKAIPNSAGRAAAIDQNAAPQTLADAQRLDRAREADLEQIARDWGPERLLDVAKAYPDSRASLNAWQALPFSGLKPAGYEFHGPLPETAKVVDRETLRSLMAAIQSPNPTRVAEGAHFVLPEDPMLRIDYLEALLAEEAYLKANHETVQADKVDDLLEGLTSRYTAKELEDLNQHLDDPALTKELQGFLRVPLAGHSGKQLQIAG